ncbi:MAG: hypothetical protein ACRCX4_13400 [Bacteroidales bacterium]
MRLKCIFLMMMTLFSITFSSCDKDEKDNIDSWVSKLKLEQTLWEGNYYSEDSPKGILVKITFLDTDRLVYSFTHYTSNASYKRSNRLLSIKQIGGNKLLDGDWIIVEANSSGMTLLRNPQSTSGEDSAKLVIKQVW